MPDREYQGVLLIGDPHLDARNPGFRKDSFAEVILGKVQWCLDYAQQHRLLPAFLGDLFDKPRGNPNWLIGRLIEMLAPAGAVTIYGNHDCADTELNEHDSLSILLAANCLTLIHPDRPLRFLMNGRRVLLGGSSYRQPIPAEVTLPRTAPQGLFDADPLVIWMTHHDIGFPGYDNPRIKPFQIEPVDLVINGHIHRRLESVTAGRTKWITPGNISRRSRSDAVREHRPAAMQILVTADSYEIEYIEIPHAPFEDVFYSAVEVQPTEVAGSDFVAGLAELVTRKTAGGAGLFQFLEENSAQFEPPVAQVILDLANEVTQTKDYPDA